MRAAEIAAGVDVTILIQGESGTGKEVLAKAIHEESRRVGGPFVAINCAALPETLADSQLFGHRKGAFTGAERDYPGLITSAAGGTLFLDEIAELPAGVQAKLLRVLEQGDCLSLGARTAHRVDVRVIAATHRDLPAAVREGRFREDLYFRLNIVPLELPPLRVRKSDISLLVEHFIAELSRQHGLTPVRFTPAALRLLEEYAWPGNVRELRNLCERMLVLRGGHEIGPTNLPPEICARGATSGDSFELPPTGIHLETLERQLITQALARTRGNRSQAARLLGLSRDTLLYRLKKHALA